VQYISPKAWKVVRIKQLDVVTKPTNTHKCIEACYIINPLFLLHVSATLVAILREAH
jgi:hypothetical protein